MVETAIQEYARNKHFSSATLQRWLSSTSADREAMFSVVATLRLGENQFRDIFDQAQEIAARRRCSLAEVLNTDPIPAILSGGLGRNEALRKLKQCLRRLRFPQLAAVEERLARAARSLGLPRGVELSFPENLEGEEVSLRLRASSPAQLRDQVDKLSAALQRAEIDEIFRILEGKW